MTNPTDTVAEGWTATRPWLIARGEHALPPELLDRPARPNGRSPHPLAAPAPPGAGEAIWSVVETLLGVTVRPYMAAEALRMPRRMSAGDRCREHTDASGWKADRYFTAVAMLSDPSDYDGGTLTLRTDRAHPIPLGRGEVVVFRSRTPHAVTPVTRGERCTIVGHFEPFPRSPAVEALP